MTSTHWHERKWLYSAATGRAMPKDWVQSEDQVLEREKEFRHLSSVSTVSKPALLTQYVAFTCTLSTRRSAAPELVSTATNGDVHIKIRVIKGTKLHYNLPRQNMDAREIDKSTMASSILNLIISIQKQFTPWEFVYTLWKVFIRDALKRVTFWADRRRGIHHYAFRFSLIQGQKH